MTVEQTALPAHNKAENSEKSPESEDYAKICEFTGKDRQDINTAIKACQNSEGNYEVEDVINWLISHDSSNKQIVKVPSVSTESPPDNKEEEGTSSSTFIGPQNKPGSNTTPGVIDLTHENTENEEIQRAIAESLRDNQGILGGQISREEQDISRVLEQSLLEETKAGTKRKRGDIWFVDPLNPHERKRAGEWPIGLKNVGNTCWFSAVIQSLFHLPKFRTLVLNYGCPSDAAVNSSTEHRNIQFMGELRKLFALMLRSKKKYVDPSRAVEILKEAFTNASGAGDTQQDVSEFQHKLLDWLEDAFRSYESRPQSPEHGASGCSSEPAKQGTDVERSTNPMVQLFYGQYKAEGVNEGKSFSNVERFGQFPLQVDGFCDIHESLEGSTAQGEIEAVSEDITSKSRQELWFTRLPSLLTFELSRFQFNQSIGRPEKIHNKLAFPEVIYMDRYMECNQCVTRQKREEVKRLKEKLAFLQGRLDKFINYGSGSKRFPLQDVLQYALEFAQSRNVSSPPRDDVLSPFPGQDVEMESPKSYISMMTDSPAGTPTKPEPPPPPLGNTPPSVTMDTPPKLLSSEALTIVSVTTKEDPLNSKEPLSSPVQETMGPTSPLLKTPPPFPNPQGVGFEAPSPRNVSQKELLVLQQCLRRWRTEVEQDVKELQDDIGQLEQTINSMYSLPQLQKCPYRLHAVLVHEGQAASGHYWAYVYSSKYQKWLKFNDITVTEASWEEIEREGSGGYHNTSAYCLIYVDLARMHDLNASGDSGQAESADDGTDDVLPTDLISYVQEDNLRFCREIEEWDAEKKRAATRTASTETLTKSSQATSTGPVSSRADTPISTRVDPATYHAQHAVKHTYELVLRVSQSKTFSEKGPEAALQEVFQDELTRMNSLAQSVEKELPQRDPRLTHALVYFQANGVNCEQTIKQLLLEPFTYMTGFDTDQSIRKIRHAALTELNNVKQKVTTSDFQKYQYWHRMYQMYRRSVCAFISGLEEFNKEVYLDALPFLTFAVDTNRTLQKEGKWKCMDMRLVSYFHRQCLLHVNEHVASQCEVNECITEYLDMMNKLVLPCLTLLTSSDSPDDQLTVEEIRSSWCKFLNLDMSESKLDKLQELLSLLFDTPLECRPLLPQTLLVEHGPELAKHYEQVLVVAKEAGHLEAAMATVE